MKNEILILGKGFIGERLQEALGYNISDRKIYSFTDAESEINKYNPKIVINCIGYNGEKNSVDGCEFDKDKTLFANTCVPIILGEVCLRKKIKLVHISTGYVHFLDLFYSRSKLYAERMLKSLCAEMNVLILRLQLPLDNRPHPKNLLTKLIKYKKVIDIPVSVSYLPDFIKALKYLIDTNAYGIYNLVNKGELKYSELLDTYKKYVPDFDYEIKDLKLNKPNIVLSTKKLERSGFKIRHIKETLEECVQNYENF